MTVYPIQARRCCVTCGGFVSRRKPTRIWCSRACYHGRLLPLLRQCAHTWMTASDLAIWWSGDDAPADIHAVRQGLVRLRRQGHVIETCAATWMLPAPRSQARRAYRLVEAARLEGVA